MQVDSNDTTTTASSNITIENKKNNEDELSFASFYYSLKVSKGKGKLYFFFVFKSIS